MSAVFKRELRSYFHSMVGYVYIAAAVFLIGIYFLAYNLANGYPSFSYAATGFTTIFMFLIPLITMKSISEERKLKTDQLLLTAPVKLSSIVLGKFFAMLIVLAIPLVLSCLCPLIIKLLGTSSNLTVDYAVIFSIFCLGAMLISLGMFISSLTENQLIAAVITLIFFFILNMWENIIGLLPTTAFVSYIGFLALWLIVTLIFYYFTKHVILSTVVGAVGIAAIIIMYFYNSAVFEKLLVKFLMLFSIMQPVFNVASYSVLDIGGIFMYLSFTALFLYLTSQMLQKRRLS